VSGHAFIAFHPREIEYRDRLAVRPRAAGIEVWSESAAEYGTNWLTVVRPKIDSCGVFVVLMTQHAEASDWIDRQVARAVELGVPIRPLLLQGQWTFKRLHNAAVRSGTSPRPAASLFTRVFDGELPRQPYVDDLLVALREGACALVGLGEGRVLHPVDADAVRGASHARHAVGWPGASREIR